MSKEKKAKGHTAGKMRKLSQVVRDLPQQHNSHKQTKQLPPETIEYKQAEKTPHESEEQYRPLFDHAGGDGFFSGLDGQVQKNRNGKMTTKHMQSF